MDEGKDDALAETLLAGADTDAEARPGAVWVPQPGESFGRFVVLEVLGQGAMGVVLKARDPDLDREVALKVIRPTAWSLGSAGEARHRLQREAKALAKLSHPNVLAVHETGAAMGQVYLVTELAHGGTLRAWLHQHKHGWHEALGLYLQAARGLCAAHDAGLVHRDFKPENVLLTADGTVRVADFGLVGAAPRAGELNESLDEEITQTGVFIGTPAYMAPEQHENRDVGPAADQFSFCVSLWEAVYGRRPFRGRTVEEVSGNIAAGILAPPPPGRRVPVWLDRVLRRGLEPDPAHRWPSMRALLLALERGRRPRTWLLPALVPTLALAIAVGWLIFRRPSSMTPSCRGFEKRMAGVWDAPRRAAVRVAFLGTGRPYASDVFDRTAALLDARAGAWIQARADACAATFERGEQSPQLLDQRMRCLDDRLDELRALVEVFGRAQDTAVLDKAIEAADGLRKLDRCADTAALARIPAPPDTATAGRVAVLTSKISDAEMLEAGGHAAEALPLARDVVAASANLYPPFHAHALYVVGVLLEQQGDLRGAEENLRLAADEARAASSVVDEALARIALLAVVARDPRRGDDLVGLRSAAERTVEQADRPPHLQAALLTVLGLVALERNQLDEAERSQLQALELRQRTLGPDDLDVAVTMNNLGVVLDRMGKGADAAAYHRRALTIREAILGADHPHVAVSLNNLGTALYAAGDLDGAEEALGRALAIRERDFGADSLEVAETASNLGTVFQDRGRYPRAEELARRALKIREARLGHDHNDTASSVNNLANAVSAQGKLDEALALHQRALAFRTRVLGADHPDTASSFNNVGDVLFALGRFADANAAYQQATDIWSRTLGPRHPYSAVGLMNLAGVADALGHYPESLQGFTQAHGILVDALGEDHPLALTALTGVASGKIHAGRARDALPLAEKVLARREASPGDPAQLADARFLLARALWATGGDRRRARELAEQARAGFTTAGAPYKRNVAEIDAWVADAKRGRGGRATGR